MSSINDLVKEAASRNNSGGKVETQPPGPAGDVDIDFSSWPTVPKMSRVGMFSKYKTLPVIIVLANGDVLLSSAVYNAMGHPSSVEIRTHNKNIVLLPSCDKNTGFMVSSQNGKNDYDAGSFMRICPGKFTRDNGMVSKDKQRNVYQGVIVKNAFMVSLEQTPISV